MMPQMMEERGADFSFRESYRKQQLLFICGLLLPYLFYFRSERGCNVSSVHCFRLIPSILVQGRGKVHAVFWVNVNCFSYSVK